MVKDLLANAGDMGSIPGSRRSTGGGNDNPVQYFRWKIPWAEEPGGLHSMESQNVRHNLARTIKKKKKNHSLWQFVTET